MVENKSIYLKLAEIQNELKAPKNQYNSFGKYAYRSAEDILEAVKPLNLAQGLVLIVSDDIEVKEGRYYVTATATLYDDQGNHIQTVARAREPEDKKGMDESQITGATSSYARKYALNGLYAIDDSKDSDSNEHGTQTGWQNQQTRPGNQGQPSKQRQANNSQVNHSQGSTNLQQRITNGLGVLKSLGMTDKDIRTEIETLNGVALEEVTAEKLLEDIQIIYKRKTVKGE